MEVQSYHRMPPQYALQAQALQAACNAFDGTCWDLALFSLFNLYPAMPAFFLAFERGTRSATRWRARWPSTRRARRRPLRAGRKAFRRILPRASSAQGATRRWSAVACCGCGCPGALRPSIC